MKDLILIKFILLTSFSYSQEAFVKMFNNSISLRSDSSRSTLNYIFYERNVPVKPQRVEFNNIPDNQYETDDGYGGKYIAVDKKSTYDLFLIDTIQTKDLKIDFYVKDFKIDSVSFCFQILSKSKRVSHTRSPRMPSNKVPQYLAFEVSGIEDPIIILYAIEFYEESRQHTIDIGYNAFIVR